MSPTTHYNILVFGEPSVGKTCFIDQFCFGKSFVNYDLNESALSHEIVVDGRAFTLALMDLSTSFLKPEQSMHPRRWAEEMLANADGVVLLYDVTNVSSFEYVTDQAYGYLWDCRRPKDADSDENEHKTFGCILVGNKADLVSGKEQRQVDRAWAAEWAETQGIKSVEVNSLARAGPESALKLLLKHLLKAEKLGSTKLEDGRYRRTP